MNKATKAVSLLLFALTLTACGNGQGEGAGNAQDSTQVVGASEAPYAEEAKKDTFTAQLAGKQYEITIERKADKGLPVVTDDMGKQFYDNRVDVRIACEGKEFFNKSYTKETFSDYLSSSENQGTVLLGMAFDPVKSDGHAIYLGTQIGQVGIEEGPAFSIEIPLDGSAQHIVRDRNQDTTGDDGMGD